ncbi:glycosyltransferase family 4 protein [Mucilaginibacter sp. SD-g]|uniref:Glycosyltransferase family 4 protein n=2 Tax=Mucilaginibacter segetis TaxID=2793071 RepID=A0A934PTR4_9SPHI|nr:glycosyltransferase family 4 protein [Mucilaginibacter segetis]
MYLHEFLSSRGVSLNAIELFGKGSPYTFDSVNTAQAWWTCLFPDKSAPDLNKEEIKAAVFEALDRLLPDIIIGPSIVFYAGAIGIAWAKKHKSKFIMFDDARPLQVKRNKIIQWVKDTIIRQADGLWLPSKSYDSDYPEFKTAEMLFFYGFACINNNAFKPETIKQFKNKNIICVARLVPVKNLSGLLKAWQVVEKNNTGYNLKIIGDGPERENLERLITDLDLKMAAILPAVDNDKLSSYFNNADAFVLPSFSETWGLVVNEAMAAGLPVLLSKEVNAARDLLKSSVNGFSFDPYNIDDMAQTLLKFIDLPVSEKEEMNKKALQIIDLMSYEKMGKQLLAALRYLNAQKFKTPGMISALIISNWHGRYNTSGWDKL